MDLKLLVIQKDTKDYLNPKYRFVVVDLAKSRKYPENFVCILPKSIKLEPNPKSTFEKVFGKKSKDLAIDLLKTAMKAGYDSRTKIAIKQRLTLYEPKLPNKIKCPKCGKLFNQNKRGRKYITCYKCFLKRFNQK